VGAISTERMTPRRALRRPSMWLLGPVLLVTLTGCSKDTVDSLKRLGLPRATTDRAVYIHDLWIGSWIAAGCIGFLVWGLILWAAFRYRRRSDDEMPVQTRYNLPIEVLYTVAPIIVIAVLFFFTVETQNKVLASVDHPDHEVQVVGQQWSWTFDYLHESAIGGKSVYDVGTPAQEPTLWVVKDKTVTFDLRSPDVIHSFWVPSFAMKLDDIPGRENSFSVTPTRIGEFAGRCAELCGWQHSRMLFTLKVVNEAAFDAHMRDLLAAGQVGAPIGGEQATTITGQEGGGQ
jgi:cytochrome c oxidase subunit II